MVTPLFPIWYEDMTSRYLDPRQKYYFESVLGGLPVIGAYFTARDKVAYMEDYMRNRGLDWSNIKYPTMTHGYSGVAGLTSFVSSNIERLYR